MWIEYQRLGWKEYVSLKRYYNLLCKCKILEEENKNLEEKVETLELWLDNKEKVNKSLREEIKDHQLYEEKLEHKGEYRTKK